MGYYKTRVSSVKLYHVGVKILNNAIKRVVEISDEMLKEFNTKDIDLLLRFAKNIK